MAVVVQMEDLDPWLKLVVVLYGSRGKKLKYIAEKKLNLLINSG